VIRTVIRKIDRSDLVGLGAPALADRWSVGFYRAGRLLRIRFYETEREAAQGSDRFLREAPTGAIAPRR